MGIYVSSLIFWSAYLPHLNTSAREDTQPQIQVEASSDLVASVRNTGIGTGIDKSGIFCSPDEYPYISR
jgi:hypothetical protein